MSLVCLTTKLYYREAQEVVNQLLAQLFNSHPSPYVSMRVGRTMNSRLLFVSALHGCDEKVMVKAHWIPIN